MAGKVQFAVKPAEVVLALKFTAVPAQTVVAEAVICGSFTLTVMAVRVVLSQAFSVCEAYTVWPSVKVDVLASKFPPVAASYHCTPVPKAVKLATVMAVPAQKVWVAEAVGAGVLLFTVMVTSFLQVVPFTVTSHQ